MRSTGQGRWSASTSSARTGRSPPAARARAGQACYLFDPFAEDGRTARWNPFSYVSPDPERRLNDLQRIAEMLYPDPTNGDPFWTASARSLFLGIALYLFETPSLARPRSARCCARGWRVTMRASGSTGSA